MPLFACYSRVDIPRDLINYKKKELEKKYVRIATNYSHESSKELCQILLNECSIQNTKILITLGYYGLLNSQLAVLNKTNILQMFLIMSKVRDYNCLLVYKSGILRILYKYAMVLKTERRYCFNKNIPQSEIKRFSEYVIHVLEEFANYNSFDSLIAEGVPPGVKKLCEESKIIKSKLIKKGIKFTMDSFETPYHRNISMNTMGGSNDMVVVKTFPEKLKELQNDLFSLENQMTQLGLFDPDVRPEESIISDLISSLSLYEYRAQNLIQESVDAEQMELYDDTVTLLDYIKYLINILKTKICESLNSNYIETHLSAQEFEQFVTIPQTEEHHESNIDENNIEINLEIQEIEQLEQSDASTEFFDSASDEEEIEEVMVDDTEQEQLDDMRKERDKEEGDIDNKEKETRDKDKVEKFEETKKVIEEKDKDSESKSLEQLVIEVEKEYKDKEEYIEEENKEKENILDKYKLLDNYDSSDNKINNINKSLLSTVDELITTRSESSYPEQQVIDKTSNLDGKHVLFENIVDDEEELEETDSETIEVDSDDELEEVVSIDSREERKYKENEMSEIKERVMENEIVESEYEEESNEENDEMDSDVEEVVDEDTDDREYYEEFRKLEEDIEDDIDEELEIMYNKDDYLDDELIYEDEDDTFSDKKDLYLFEKEFSESSKLEQKLSLDILKNEKLEDKKEYIEEENKEKEEKKLSEHLEREQEILVDSHKSLSKEQLEIEKLEEEKLFWSTEDKDSSEKTSLFSVMSKSKSLSLEEVVEDRREKDKDKEKEDKEYKGDETKKVIEKKLEKVKFKDVKEMVKKIENKSLGQLDIEDNRDIETKVIIVETKERKDVKETKEKELLYKKEETKETKKVIEEKDNDKESKSLEQLEIEVEKEDKDKEEKEEEENKEYNIEKEELKEIKHELILPVRKEDESIKELYNEMSYVMDTLKRINNYLESKPPKFVANSKNYQNIQSSSFRSLSFDNINISNLYNNNTQERLDNNKEYRDIENKEKLERDIYKTQDNNNNNNNMNMKFNRDELQLKKIENKLELELGEQFLEKERQLKQQLFNNIDDNLFKRISNIYLPKKNLPMTSTILPYDNSFVTSSIASSNHPQYNITNNYYSTTHNPRNYYNTNNTTNLPHNYYNTTNTTHTHGTTNYYSTNSTHSHSHSYGSSHNYYNTNNHTNNYNTNSSSCIYNYYYSYDDSSLQQINENKTSDEKGIHREINKNMIIFKKGIPSDNLRNRLMINFERKNKEYKDKEEYIEGENENKEKEKREDKEYKENKKSRGLDYNKDQEFNTNNNIVLEPNNELKQLNKLTKLLSLDVTSDNNEKETRDKDKVEKFEETKKLIEEKDKDSEREYTDTEEEGDIDNKEKEEREYTNKEKEEREDRDYKEKTYREEKNTYENGYPVIDISEFENLEEESLMGRDSNRELEVELESLDRSEYRDNRRYEDKDDMDDSNRDDYIDKEYEESEREDIESREERKFKENGRNERKYKEKEMNERKERVMEETDSETKYYNKENRMKGTRLERNRKYEREYTDREEDSEIEKEGKEIRKNKDKKERKYKEYIYPQEVHHTHHYYKRSVHHYTPHNSNKYDYYDPRYEEREYNENNETKYYNKEYEREYTDRKYERDIDKKNKNKYKERDYQEKKERRNKKEEYRQYERNYDIDNNRIYDNREYRDYRRYEDREYRDDRRYEDRYYYEDNYRRTPLREQYPRNELYYVIEPNSSNEILNKKNKNIRIDYDSRYYDMEYDEKENKKYKDRKIIEVNDSNSSLSGRNMEYIKNREYDRNNDTRYEDREYRDNRRYDNNRDDYIDKEYRDRYYDEVDSELEQEMTYREEDNMREKINKKQDKENNEKEYYNNEYNETKYYNKEYKENNINSTPRTTFRTTFRSESVTSNNIEEENRIIYDNNVKENNITGLEYINEDEIKYYNKEINKEYDKYSEKYKVSDNIDNMMITNSNIIKNVIKYGGDIIYEDKMILIKFTQSPIYHPGNNTYIQLEHNYTMSTENILILENNSLFSYSISFDYSNFDNFPLDIKFLNNKFNKIELIPGQKLTHRFNADCFGPFIGLPKLNLTIHIDIKTDKIFQIYLPLAISCFFTPSMDMFRLSKSYFNSDKFKHIMRNKVYFNTPKKINLGQIMEIVTGFGKFKLLQQAENCYYLASSFSAPFYFGTKELYRFTIFAMIEVSTSHYHVHVSSDSYRLANSTSMLLKYILQN